MEANHKIRLIYREEIAQEVYYIKLERLEDFTPGQLLALSDSPGGDVRYYSIASATRDEYWGILYNKMNEGWLTPWLSRLQKGDILYTSLPFGEFLPRRFPMVWIATGTGIAPFHSMTGSGCADEDTILIHGARQKEDFYFYEDFRQELKSRYIACSSTSEQPGLYPGRLSRYLEEEFSYRESPEERRFFLCGSSAMVVDIRDLLLSEGGDCGMITSEIYF
jgi:ferredoxin--NADP+ reductase